MQNKISKLESKIEKIEQRNKSVELDKSWETSYSRKIIILILTYIAIGIYMHAVELPDPWLNAIVPSFAFMLSTLTLPFFKNLWGKYFYRK